MAPESTEAGQPESQSVNVEWKPVKYLANCPQLKFKCMKGKRKTGTSNDIICNTVEIIDYSYDSLFKY